MLLTFPSVFLIELHPTPILMVLLDEDSDDPELMDLSIGRDPEPLLSAGFHESSKFTFHCFMYLYFVKVLCLSIPREMYELGQSIFV